MLATPLSDGQQLARRILLLDLAADDHAVNRRAAARSWGRQWGREALPAAPHLRDHILEERHGAVLLAATTLVAIGPEGLPYLREALATEHAVSRTTVLQVLEGEGAAVAALVPAVLPLLKDPDEGVCLSAAAVLESMQVADARVGAALRAAVRAGLGRDPRASDLGERACRALHGLGFDDPDTLDAFERAARDAACDGFREVALEAFWARSTDRARALALVQDLRHIEALEARTTEMLVEGGRDDPDLIERYVEGLPRRMDDERRVTAAEQLVRTGPNGRQACIDLAFRVLDWGKDDASKVRAARVLAQTGREGRANEHIEDALRVHADPDHEPAAVVTACRAALSALGFDPDEAPAEESDDDD